MAETTVRVYLDTDEGRHHPLEAVRVLPTRWNGWLVPVVTAAEFHAFVASWRAADPNGSWGRTYVRLGDDALVHISKDEYDPDDPSDEWLPTGERWHGVDVYAVDGWTWVA